ncbi:MAG: hypothetical protein J6X50_00035 [Bacilli bacterium]|nr:hypothetical protein [Bacilli bacterium]
MAVFQKKTTLVHHITYMGIMTAINLIFIVLATYIPFLMFLLILLIPFVSAIVSYYCLKRYYLIYAIASVGLCLIFNISDTIFYVVPSIVTGFLIGVLLEKKINPFWLILSSSIVESALTFALIPLINLIGSVDIVYTFLTLFKLTEFTYKTEVTYLFIFFLSLVQCALTHFVLLSDAKKIGIEVSYVVNSYSPYIVGTELMLILCIVFSFFYTPLSLIFLMISFYFGIFLLIDLLLSKKTLIYVLLGISVLTSFFTFAFLYATIKQPLGLLIFLVFPFLIAVISFINNYLLKAHNNT